MKSVISFDLQYSVPRQILDLEPAATERLSSLVPRLNVHHKQLFFSDNPIFVEGILDAQLVETMQEARGVSIAGAGSCIIDAGGCEEVNHYLDLCKAFGKRAYFLYDLDSLFDGHLRACVRSDGSVQSFLRTAGVGNDFSRYCGGLETKLTEVIDRVLAKAPLEQPLDKLGQFLIGLGEKEKWDKHMWAKARVAVMTATSLHREAMASALSEGDIEDIEGRINQIVAALREKNVLLLPGGTLEIYLPSYTGNPYDLADSAKGKAVTEEIGRMASPTAMESMEDRYGDLYKAVCALPGKVSVDTEPVLRDYLGDYIHDLQGAVVKNPNWELSALQEHMNTRQPEAARLFSVREFGRGQGKEFSAVVSIPEMLGQGPRVVRVSEQTNAGMGDFEIEILQ